jgi:hypothetical protein
MTLRTKVEELTIIALYTREPKLSEFLHWIGNRLEHVYGESPNIDFVQACHARAKQIEEIEEELNRGETAKCQ